MSDSKRTTLITVGDTKSEKNKVNKTVRLTINLVESNESKYPELNYKELVIAEDRKHRVENGKISKTDGLNPYSDNDDDVERVARRFEQKYGGKSTYGRKGRSKHDDFADIGAGYDENDSFIDNTDGYDEMIPPECDTLYGGFYINSGSLEFKNVDTPPSDDEPRGRRNKRRISSSSSEESSESSSESEASRDDKEPKAVNGTVHSHDTEHRKKKNKKVDKKKPKKIRRTDSSAPTSGKQTSDDNVQVDGESVDSRTSQSDSLTSKPAPSSENPITSDSSRDNEAKVEAKLPAQVTAVLEELEAVLSRHLLEKPTASHKELQNITEHLVLRLDRTLSKHSCEKRARGVAWARCARALRLSRTKLLQRVRALAAAPAHPAPAPPAAPTTAQPPANPTHNSTSSHHHNKRKVDDELEDVDVTTLSEDETEAKIVEILQRLKALIDEREPGMMANYNAECERVQEERKKLQSSGAESRGETSKRLPKRRFPWCARSRALLSALVRLSREPDSAALLLARRALPLFPSGFVRMPTLLRQADLSKELKVSDIKRQKTGNSCSQSYQPLPPNQPPPFTEPIHFPSSLTVTTMKTPDKPEVAIVDDKDVQHSVFGSIINSFTLSKDLIVETQDEKKKETDKKEDLYIPPNNIGSITITPVINQKPEKKVNNVQSSDKQKDGLIRIKSPAALNEMVHKQEKNKALENIHKRDKEKHKKEKSHSHSNEKTKDKSIDTPLHIDTSYQTKQKEPTPSPKTKEEISQRTIESMRVAESNIPRPALIPVHNSPTFAKPDKRPPEKKKKDLLIVSDLDPLAEVQVTEAVVAVDDSSSDVEVVEDKSDKSETVPSKDKVSAVSKRDRGGEEMDDATKEDFDSVMKNLRDLEHSRDTPKFNSASFGGVITSASSEKSSGECGARSSVCAEPRSDKDKLTNFFEQNGWM